MSKTPNCCENFPKIRKLTRQPDTTHALQFTDENHRKYDPAGKIFLLSFINQMKPEAKAIPREDLIDLGEFGDVLVKMPDNSIVILETEVRGKNVWASGKFPFWRDGTIHLWTRKLNPAYSKVKWFHWFSYDGLGMFRVLADKARKARVILVRPRNSIPQEAADIPLSWGEFFRRASKTSPWQSWDGKTV